MNSIEISIIIPVYNCSRSIGRLLEIILSSTDKRIEVVVVNDGSTDSTAKVVGSFASRYDNVKYVYQNNAGVSSARNVGVAQAAGRYIWFIDGDDTIALEAIQYLLNEIKDSDYDLLIFGYTLIGKNNKTKAVPPHAIYSSINEFLDNFENLYHNLFLSSPWNKLYKRKLIKKGFVEGMQYFEDFHFFLDYLESVCSVKIINVSLYNYVACTTDSLVKQFTSETAKHHYRIYERFEKFITTSNYTGNKAIALMELYASIFNCLHKAHDSMSFTKYLNYCRKELKVLIAINKYDKNRLLVSAYKHGGLQLLLFIVLTSLKMFNTIALLIFIKRRIVVKTI